MLTRLARRAPTPRISLLLPLISFSSVRCLSKCTTILTGNPSNPARLLKEAAGILIDNTLPPSPSPSTPGPSSGLRPERVARPFDAAVVLASRSLARRLEDPDFMRPLLRMTGAFPRGVVPPPDLTVLAAVVDGIPDPRSAGAGAAESVAEGLSVLQGYADEVLPGFSWQEVERVAGAADSAAALVLRVPTLVGEAAEAEAEAEATVTVPTANTVFVNGRASMVVATRWRGASWREFAVVGRRDVGPTVVVRVPLEGGGGLRLRVPLVAVTPLRKVHSALGNILRSFQGDGGPVPASRELEVVIPTLVETRREMGLREAEGGVRVWALVVPARLGGELRAREMMAERFAGGGREKWSETTFPAALLRWLIGRGCRLHRVLSGGGGWGAKQGLLSLDPQTQFASTDEEDVERFERAFLASQGGDDGGGSIVGPGDMVMFLVERATYPSRRVAPGTAVPNRFVARVTPDKAAVTERTGSVFRGGEQAFGKRTLTFEGVFGVVSSEALFVDPAGECGHGTSKSFKLDTPGSELFVAGPTEMQRPKKRVDGARKQEAVSPMNEAGMVVENVSPVRYPETVDGNITDRTTSDAALRGVADVSRTSGLMKGDAESKIETETEESRRRKMGRKAGEESPESEEAAHRRQDQVRWRWKIGQKKKKAKKNAASRGN